MTETQVESPPLSVRPYTPEDFASIHQWRQGHDRGLVVETCLPPLGCIIEDEEGPVAALFCYEPAGIGCAYLELPVTRPGLSMRQAWAALSYAVECLIKTAGKGWKPPGEYNVFRVCAPAPIARMLMRIGFQRESTEELIPLIYHRPPE